MNKQSKSFKCLYKSILEFVKQKLYQIRFYNLCQVQLKILSPILPHFLRTKGKDEVSFLYGVGG